MQALNEHLIQRGREMMTDYVNLDNQCLAESQASNQGILEALAATDGTRDSAYFSQLMMKPWADPPEFPFESCAEIDGVTTPLHPSFPLEFSLGSVLTLYFSLTSPGSRLRLARSF